MATVSKTDRLHRVPLQMAKASVGACMKAAIGDRTFKEFGDTGLITNVVNGDRVPDYLARIYMDKAARRRLALALLSDDDAVRVRTVVEWDEEKVEKIG